MSNPVEHLEQQVAQLSEAELAQFRAWFAAFDAAAWDQRIEQDAAAGKLDALANQALAAHRAGASKPL
jgi:hypothetical protein